MKYSPQTYAEAFIRVLTETPRPKREELVKRFLNVVRKNGDTDGIGKVFDAVRRRVIKEGGGSVISLSFAREISAELRERISKIFSHKDLLETETRPELIAGVRIFVDGEFELDVSLRRKLKRLLHV